ncbi:MAG: hypothetical protein ACXWUU_16345 [Burkholderiales bacterium]
MTAIHLVERSDNVRKTDKSKNEWETGYWEMTEETAQKLIGSVLYLHRAKLHASHFGGTILGYRVVESGPEAGRVAFKLRADADCKGVKTDAKGWSKDYKIFWDAPVPTPA